jgi:membrane protease YdiL (CAAX protease family)
LLLTSVLFVASHPDHYIQNGELNPLVLLSFAFPGLVLGLLRWRTGSTTICIMAHALTNVCGDLATVLAFDLEWDCAVLKDACETAT